MLSLRSLVVILITVALGINVVIAATGNMHAGKDHPGWVNVLSWLFAAIAWALIVLVFIAWRRRGRRRAARNGG
jgi:hypothetical protein